MNHYRLKTSTGFNHLMNEYQIVYTIQQRFLWIFWRDTPWNYTDRLRAEQKVRELNEINQILNSQL